MNSASLDLALHVPPGGSLATGPFRTTRLNHLLALARERIPHYGFVRLGPIPFRRLSRPLAQARVALVTTAGCHLRGDVPFRALEEPLGDPSYRWIPHDPHGGELDIEQPYVDGKYLRRDPECALPRRALDALSQAGVIGTVAERHATFVGGVVWPFPDLTREAAGLAREFLSDGVDCVVLTPTCSFCVQSVAAISRELEAAGLSTVGISLLAELSEIVGAPRTLAPHFPFGAPVGDPGNAPLHRAILGEALDLIVTQDTPGRVVPSRYAWRKEAKPPAPTAD